LTVLDCSRQQQLVDHVTFTLCNHLPPCRIQREQPLAQKGRLAARRGNGLLLQDVFDLNGVLPSCIIRLGQKQFGQAPAKVDPGFKTKI